MTVPYTSLVATTTYSTFLRLLFIWKGSVYRLIWLELLIFVSMYTVMSLSYRYLMSGSFKVYFELACIYCHRYNDFLPIPFVLGFYVALVVSRWWEQFLTLPWPDEMALYMTAYCHGNNERATRIRRTVMRYINLSYCLALRAMSSRARLRFPTHEHLVSSGLMTQEELEIYTTTPPLDIDLYFAPVVWAMDMIVQARREGLIRFDRAVEVLSESIMDFRGKLGTLFIYDWINPPLVYTQTTTIVVYSYFISCLFAWQYLDPEKQYAGYDVDIYVPVFGFLRFFFYVGWLKVAESLLNPFGEDMDDFEIEYLIERNLNVSYLIVDGMHHEHPDLVKDAYWTTGEDHAHKDIPGELNFISSEGDRFIGSLANMELSGRKFSTTRQIQSNINLSSNPE